MTAALEFRGVGKQFPGVRALDDVSFVVSGGEVRALIGENGAGKSTLLKILAGDLRPDSGKLLVDGEPAQFATPRDSQNAGIAIIHQELQLAPNLSVAENLLLGAMPRRMGLLDRAAMHSTATAILARLGEKFDAATRVGDLSIGKRQMVEIGRALLRDARVIAFDEPTSSLSAPEIETLKLIIRQLREEGRAIVYVSHRMEEIFELADSVTVLRDGRHVRDWPTIDGVDQPALISAMAGRTIEDIYRYRPRATGLEALEVTQLSGPGLAAPASLTVARGEIVGLFGLVGAGRTELLKLIFGATRSSGGSVTANGIELLPGDPRAAIAAKVALCPEDRKDEGIIPLASVAENIALAKRNLGARSALLETASERTTAIAMVDRLRIKAASPEVAIGTLSGGNQQKTIIARWLVADAEILLFDEPTRGIDVGARSEIYAELYTLAEAGRTILFASSDLPEVLGVADRVLVMNGGRIVADVPRAEATPDRLLELALPAAPASIQSTKEV